MTKALKTLTGVKDVKASASENKAVITLTAPVSDEDIEKVIEDAGYKVLNKNNLEAEKMKKTLKIQGMT